MPSASLAAYLAKNYLTASGAESETQLPSDFQDSSRPKKKRRKHRDAEPGLFVADDHDDLSLRGAGKRAPGDGDDDPDLPTYDTNVKSAEFRKKKGGGAWKVVSNPTGTAGGDTGSRESALEPDADRILAQAAEEAAERRREIEEEDAPTIVDTRDRGDPDAGVPRMESGARAGLQTAADTAALVERERQQELEEARRAKAQSKSKSKSSKGTRAEEETIYRDATGRRIDISLKRAEARTAEAERIKAEKRAQEEAMGEVQRRDKEQRKQDLEDAKFLTLGRSADDEEMNESLKQQLRWDDPMAVYMAQKQADESASTAVAARGEGRRASRAAAPPPRRKKAYQGHAAPNRYGILPGWRWDGVDRGNGFEKDWFQARSRSARNEDLQYQWQMDE